MAIVWFLPRFRLSYHMDYVVDPAEFATPWAIMLDIVSLTCTTLVLYGLYIVLFIYAIRALTQGNLPRRRAFLVTTSVMFFLGTFKGVLQGSNDLSRLVEVLGVPQLTEVVRVTLNNAVMDLLFLYRCYMIWGSKKKVLILPALCILASVVLNVVVGNLQTRQSVLVILFVSAIVNIPFAPDNTATPR
ncbi:hypothetical protein K438DRAFT_1955426 [Mycena galopus ATCC 62051]|nr:hypothetical protein K438DRAFT_1955426 [Mycena galopus ATCC 62051]